MVFNGAEAARRRKKGGRSVVGNDDDDDDVDDDERTIVAVSCPARKREENAGRKAANDAPLAFLLPADTMSGRISFSAVVTHPPAEG